MAVAFKSTTWDFKGTDHGASALAIGEQVSHLPWEVVGLDTSATFPEQLEEAVAWLKTNLPANFPDDTTQVLIHVGKAESTRPGEARGVATYGRHPVLTAPVVKAYKLAQFRSTVKGLRYYSGTYTFDANGRPNGTIDANYLARWVRNGHPGVSFPVQATHIIIPTVLTSDPSTTVQGMKGYLNNEAAAFTLGELATVPEVGGLSIAQYTLWFLGVDVTPVELVGAAVRYVVRYSFMWTPTPGWVQQTLNIPVPGIVETFVTGGLTSAPLTAKVCAMKNLFPM